MRRQVEAITGLDRPSSPAVPLFNRCCVWRDPDGERTGAYYEERTMEAAYFSQT
jgi:hypothetical protein